MKIGLTDSKLDLLNSIKIQCFNASPPDPVTRGSAPGPRHGLPPLSNTFRGLWQQRHLS